MDTLTEDTRLPQDIDAQPVVRAAAALAPTLRRYRDAIEREQRLPDELVGSTFYEPSDHGRERVLVEQWRERTQAEDER